ncbi:hypothetical protein RI534_13205 [Aeromonas allosaccharophila]|uniref:hypothetical protein n=1 Tax=Aeromonas allosaccharophila TaxID=656 RepID=UPI00342E467F
MLEQMLAKLEEAKKDLAQWQQQDLTRSDGSERQDRLHEEFGRELKQSVEILTRKVQQMKGNG